MNTTDTEDFYELTLSGSGYLMDGAGVRSGGHPTIRVKGTGGAMTRDARLAAFGAGPVLTEKNGKAVAVRVACSTE